MYGPKIRFVVRLHFLLSHDSEYMCVCKGRLKRIWLVRDWLPSFCWICCRYGILWQYCPDSWCVAQWGIVDFRNNRFQCLFLAYIFPKLSIYRQYIAQTVECRRNYHVYIAVRLIGPSKRYLRIIIYMDARRIIWEQGDYFLLPMRSCNGQKQRNQSAQFYSRLLFLCTGISWP